MKESEKRPKSLEARNRLGARVLRERNQRQAESDRKRRMEIKKHMTDWNLPANRAKRRAELRAARAKERRSG